jgi:hypothetical protein
LGLALSVACASGGFDALLPHATANNLIVEIAPSGTATHSVLLSAHYDSRTDPFDHVVRSAILAAILLLLPLALVAQFRQPGIRRRVAWSLPAIIALSLATVQTLAPAVITNRSHGMRDNAAACALLVELCSRAAHRPLEHTRLYFAWWAAEEIGAQGSAAWVQRYPSELPDYVLNLEAIGSGDDVAIGALEWTGRSWQQPSASLATLVDSSTMGPVRRLRAPLLSDAGPFLGIGTPAITVLNLPRTARWPRRLHSKADRLESLHLNGLDATRTLLLESLRSLDTWPAPAAGERR